MKLEHPTPPSAWISHALLPVRLMIGFGFLAHGYAKLARGPEHFADVLTAMGLPLPMTLAWLTTGIELIGGLALMLGAWVMPFSIPLAVIMLTALFGVHLQYGFSSIKLQAVSAAGAVFGQPGIEVNLLYVTALLSLALHGPAPLSIDRWLTDRKRDAARSPENRT
jgi:putative oxidoreductase